MNLFKGKSIEQVVKEADEALNWTIADQTELISSRVDILEECFHKNRDLFITRNGSEHERCRDCGLEE